MRLYRQDTASTGSPPTKLDHPPLTPQFCFNTRALKDFLRTSRATIDDTINQNLNALVTPASQKFDPSITVRRVPPPASKTIEPEKCKAFTKNVLMPSWQSRSDVLAYCASVATSDDPDDPDILAERAADRERIVDERLDPYSGRFFPRATRTEALAQVIRNERMVENIVRDRTWRVVNERCGYFGASESWQEVLDAWQKSGGK
ncbi:caffeine-induced death protein 2-domain-containing protein [Sphaerosporella brunnea]|uniref:Caffeine-induced death protein 2-domain-containing protein n=1 Tax=Sphaerosporella brunnea TaxID=1250544 RepID=A0A5J5F1I8_9PEZI|nr:caffeine-induced death protein 2-domain-containing protein [Sphaerosporella brunnea]